jgi:hypothetical protein
MTPSIKQRPTLPPTKQERIRTTVSIEPEVLAVFRKMADTSGLSLSRCLGEWLADTAEGAQLVAQKMQEARRAPVTVMREVQAMLHGAHEEAGVVLAELRARKLGPDGPQARRPEKPAPSSNTGLKSPQKGKR